MDPKISAILFTYLAAFSFLATSTVLGLPTADSDDEAQQDDPSKKQEKVEVLSKPEIYTVAEGDSVTLPCEMTKDPDVAVMWDRNDSNSVLFLDKRRIFQDDSYVVQQNRSLTINHVTQQKAGPYRCYIGTSDASVVHTVAVQLKVSFGHTKKIVEVGGDIFLSCNVTGYPEPTVELYKQTSGPKQPFRRAANYTIRNANVSDSGVYECSARNEIQLEPVTAAIRISVVNGIGAEYDVVYASNFNDRVPLCCNFEKLDKSDKSSFGWLKNGVEVSSTDGHYQIEPFGKHKFCLIINKVRQDDLATYTCTVAKKSSTRINGSVPFDKANVTLSGAPAVPTQELIAVDENTKWPLLKWKVKTFSPITSYQVYIKKQEENDWKLYNETDLVTWEKEENIEQIFEKLPSGQYNVKLVVVNKHGSTEHIFSGTPLVIDKVEPGVILSAKIQGAGNPNGAVSNFQVSSLCILFSVVIRLWMSCCC